MSVFDRLLVYDDAQPRCANLNMAVDEALTENANVPMVRFYKWKRPSVSFGYFRKYADVAAYSRTHDIVRRSTGGGIVFHDSDVTYSVIAPRGHRLYELSASGSYAAIHRAIAAVLRSAGQPVLLTDETGTKISDACFANPARFDVLLHGRKIAGAAQRRTRRALLHQGSVQFEQLPADFAPRFSIALCAGYESARLNELVIERATQIAARKFATVEWLQRR
jgi:lipoate-protein ligase A